MNRFLLFSLLIVLGITTKAQVKISDMATTNADPTGGWIPVVLNGSNNKIDAGKFYNKLDSIYKKAGTDSIFTIKNGNASFAFLDNGSCCAEGPYIPQKTIAELRALTITPTAGKVYYIIDKSKQGMFRYDETDNTSTDDGVMTLVTANNKCFKRVVDDHINVKWFGALGDDSPKKINQVFPSLIEAKKSFFANPIDPLAELSQYDFDNQTIDWFALQAGINYCIQANAQYTNGNYKKLYVPAGSYILSRELIASLWYGNSYTVFTFAIEGEGGFFPGRGGTLIRAQFKNTFALGIQAGKGCTVKNITFIGKFEKSGTPLSYREFYASTFDNFASLIDPTCSDKHFAPYSGVVIDPFRNTANIPNADLPDIYTTLQAFYRGTNSSGGSSGTVLEEIEIDNFVVGVAFSPNGQTGNDDAARIDKIQLKFVKVGIAAGQAQEKTNVIKHLVSWYDVHTVFAGSYYGKGAPGQWSIEDVSLAGRVNQFIYRNDGRYFPMFVRNLFAESLGKLGYLRSEVGGSFEDSEIGFYYPIDADPKYEGYYPKWQIEGGGYTFKNCNIRFYGSMNPVSISGSHKFENCVFETVPFFSLGNNYQIPTFLNCSTTLEGGFGNTGVKASYPGYFSQNVAYGSFVLRDYLSNDYSHKQQFKYENYDPFKIVGETGNVQIDSISATGDVNIPISQVVYDKYYKFGKLVLINDNANGGGYIPLGLIKGYSGGMLTIGGARPETPVGTNITIATMLPVTTVNPFMGDLTQGLSEISNVRMDVGAGNYTYGVEGTDPQNMVGRIILLNDVPAVYNNYRTWAVVNAYNSSTKTFSLSDVTVYKTVQGAYFCNGCEKQRESKSVNGVPNNNEILQRGSKLVLNEATSITVNPTKDYRIIKTGVFNTSGVAGETRQAAMVPDFNYNNHADARFYGSDELFFTSVADANTKIDARDRKRGMTALIFINNTPTEYWYKDGITDADLVKKNDMGNLATNAWLLAGNSNTTSDHYLGTADGARLSIRTNGIERIAIDGTTGNVGIGGVATPDEKLTILGDLKFNSPYWHIKSTRSVNGIALGEEPGTSTYPNQSYLFYGDQTGSQINIGTGNGNTFHKFSFQSVGQGGDNSATYNFIYNADTKENALQVYNSVDAQPKFIINTTGRVGILTANPNSIFHVAGSQAGSVRVSTGATTLSDDDYVVINTATTATPVAFTLPSAVGLKGRIYKITNHGVTGSTITLATTPAANAIKISSTANLSSIAPGASITIISDNTTWRKIAN